MIWELLLIKLLNLSFYFIFCNKKKYFDELWEDTFQEYVSFIKHLLYISLVFRY